jgi:ketosteroid isomerase-like protein
MERAQSGPAIEAFRSYTRAFQALDARAVAQHFNEPALLITPDAVIPLATGAAVEQAYARVMAELPAKGYARTEFSGLAERRLSDDLAIVAGAGIQKTASGEALSRFGLTYTLRRTNETWRIVVASIHDHDAY